MVYDILPQEDVRLKVVDRGNTIFIGYDLEKQRHVLSKRELNLGDHNADVDDDDLLFDSLLTVPPIPSENRYCLMQHDAMNNNPIMSCFVQVNQTLRIYSYPTHNPKSRTLLSIALDDMYYGTLSSRNVFVDDQFVHLALLSTHPDKSPKGNLTLYRFESNFAVHNKSSLEVPNLKNSNLLLTNISDTHLILVCEVTEGLVIHLIEKSTYTIHDSLTLPNISLLISERSQEYYTGMTHNNTVLFVGGRKHPTHSSRPITIVKIHVNDNEQLGHDILPVKTSPSLITEPLDIGLLNYAFVLGNQLVLYSVNADNKFVYFRALINPTKATIYAIDVFPIQYKKQAPRRTPLLLLTDGNCDHFVSLMTSHIRLFVNDKTRGSSYDFSVEDPTLKKVRGSVIKQNTLVALYDSCLLTLNLDTQLYVHIYRLSYGNTRSYFTSVTADERDAYPYVYLTYNSNKRGSTHFSIFSLDTRTVVDSTTEQLVNSVGGVYHNGAIYYQTTGRMVIYEPIRNNVTIIDKLNGSCFSDDNYLYSYDNDTLLSVGEVLCDVNQIHEHSRKALILRYLVNDVSLDLTSFSFLRNRTALLFFTYAQQHRVSTGTFIEFHKPHKWEPAKSIIAFRNEHEVITAFDYYFDGELYTVALGLQVDLSMTALFILSKDLKRLVGSVVNIPIRARSAFLIDRNDILLVGDRTQFIRLTLSKTNPEVIKEDKKYDRALAIGLSIGLTSAVFVPILLVAAIGLLILFLVIRKRKKRTDDLEAKLLELEDYQQTTDLDSVMIPMNDIRIDKRLSEGASGVVFLGSWKGAPVAIKRFKVDDEESLTQEVGILAQLRHPYLLILYGVSIDDQGHHHMITPYANNGSLETLLYKTSTMISFQEKLRILSQMAQAITYLHQKEPSKIIHLDLKPHNVLLHDNNVKICDFGISKTAKSANGTMTMASSGTIEYMAPEVLLLNPYDEKVDVYSFGIMMYELFFRRKPYMDLDYGHAPIPLSHHVCLGRRPPIPFGRGTEDTNDDNNNNNERLIIEQFLQLHPLKKFQSRLHSIDFREGLVRCVEHYFSLVTRCWSQNPEDRPSFLTIEAELENIQQVWAQSNMEDTA